MHREMYLFLCVRVGAWINILYQCVKQKVFRHMLGFDPSVHVHVLKSQLREILNYYFALTQ